MNFFGIVAIGTSSECNNGIGFYFSFFILQSQFEEIERNRISMEQQKNIDRLTLEKKLKTAANTRDENMKKMLDRLKEHVRFHFRLFLFEFRFHICIFFFLIIRQMPHFLNSNKHLKHLHTFTIYHKLKTLKQNKLATRATVDARENEKAMEKLHLFENKLFIAEQNREKEIQKKLDTLRRHVRLF